MFRRLHSRRHDHRGAAAVEFALVLPVLVALVFGIIQYGIYFWARQSAVAAAREGARRASVGDYADCNSFSTFVKGQLSGAQTGTGATVTRSFTKGTGNTQANVAEVGDTMRVIVTFNSINAGLIPLPAGGTISVDTSSRLENVGSTPMTWTCP